MQPTGTPSFFSADPRWTGDVMKPEFAGPILKALEINAARAVKRVNMLTQFAMAGAEDEEA